MSGISSLLVFIGIIVFFSLSVYIWNKIQRSRGITEEEEEAEKQVRPDGCCGAHDVCEHTEEELKEKPEYFDDEELDRFERLRSHEYSEEDAEEFREIFYSMHDEEKTLWLRSLRMRHIALPDQVKHEMVQIMKSISKDNQIV